MLVDWRWSIVFGPGRSRAADGVRRLQLVTRSGRRAGEGSDADAAALYLGDVGRHPLLTKAQEVRLAQTIEAGRTARLRLDGAGGAPASLDPAALRAAEESVRAREQAAAAYVGANLRLVVSIARRDKTPGPPWPI